MFSEKTFDVFIWYCLDLTMFCNDAEIGTERSQQIDEITVEGILMDNNPIQTEQGNGWYLNV